MALGAQPDSSEQENWANGCSGCGARRPEDEELRTEVLRLMRASSMEFGELNVEYGYAYDSDAVVGDGSARARAVDEVRVYEPSHPPGIARCRTRGSRTRTATAGRSRT